jgi:hypothetical protein
VTVLVDIELPPEIPPILLELTELNELPKPFLKKSSLSNIELNPPKLPKLPNLVRCPVPLFLKKFPKKSSSSWSKGLDEKKLAKISLAWSKL